jgi:hypothetical protein
MPSIDQIDNMQRANFQQCKKLVDIISLRIQQAELDIKILENLSAPGDDFSDIIKGHQKNIEILNLNKKVYILKAKFINAFLLRDLELLKTLHQQQTEISSDFLLCVSEIINDDNINLSSIGLVDRDERKSEDTYLKICNNEKNAHEGQLEYIEFLENYLSIV